MNSFERLFTETMSSLGDENIIASLFLQYCEHILEGLVYQYHEESMECYK